MAVKRPLLPPEVSDLLEEQLSEMMDEWVTKYGISYDHARGKIEATTLTLHEKKMTDSKVFKRNAKTMESYKRDGVWQKRWYYDEVLKVRGKKG